jgi:hypothetical protein
MPGSDTALKGIFSNQQEPLRGSFFLHGYEKQTPVLVWSAELETDRGGNQN